MILDKLFLAAKEDSIKYHKRLDRIRTTPKIILRDSSLVERVEVYKK